jgi:hypothetical protein
MRREEEEVEEEEEEEEVEEASLDMGLLYTIYFMFISKMIDVDRINQRPNTRWPDEDKEG